LAHFRTFFQGPALGVTERACLASFIAHGHALTLYSYDPIDVPAGVERADASAVILKPERDAFFAMAPDRVSQFSNGFRFRMLQDGGWWVDTDVLCLSANVPAGDLVVGWENDTTIGSAVMRFPPRHPLIATANEFWITNRHVPTWGHTGPRLVTRLVKELGLAELAAPVKSLYPVGWEDALAPFDPGRRAEVEALTNNRPFLHLWNSSLFFMAVGRDLLAPRGSFLRAAVDRHLGDAVRDLPDDPFISAVLRAVQNRNDLMNQFGRRAEEAAARIEQLAQERQRLEAELARLRADTDALHASRAVRLLRKLGWA
jgi:hypothetical protein